MTTPGTGGLPTPRPDQTRTYPSVGSQAGSSSGIFRGRLVIISGSSTNGSNGLFVYSGTPGLGNLILSISAVAGTDQYGNPYPAGLSLTQGAISGSLITGSIGNSTIVSSTFTGGTITESVITFDSVGGALLVYTTNTVTQTFSTPGPISFGPVAAGTTTLDVSCWAGGLGGRGGQTGARSGNAGGGGEFAREPALAVTPGNTYTGVCGAGGPLGNAGGANPVAGTNSSFTGDSVTVTANTPMQSTTAGGAGSANTIHFNGGDGGSGGTVPGNAGGGGGGGSGGTGQAGNNGSDHNLGNGGNGGAAVTGGGAGGKGGNFNQTGTAGSAPGGGGGGGGASSGASFDGAAGANGQVIVKYFTGRALLASIAPTAGTDAFGNAYGAGITVYNSAAPAVVANGAEMFAAAGQLKYVSTDTNAYATGRLTMVCPGQTISVSAATTITGLSCPVAAGTYKFQAHVVFDGNVASRVQNAVSGPATSTALVSYLWFNAGGAAAFSQATQTSLGGLQLGPTLTAANQVLKLEGMATFTAAGTLALQAASFVNGDNLVIIAGSTFEVFPVP